MAPLVCTVGDLLLDVTVRIAGAAIVPDSDTDARNSVGAGGQAANVAAWAAALGGRGRVIAKRARDAAGRAATQELEARGVEVVGPVVEHGTGIVVALVRETGDRSMLSDRGVAPELSPEEVDPAWAADADWLHVAGYSLVRSPLAEAAAAAARGARRVSVDVSSVAAVEEIGVDEFRRRAAALRPEVVFANEQEAELVGPEAPTVVVKLGARGCRVNGEQHPARPADVVDTTGAGDAFAAGFLLGGVELALDAAARCVARVGSMP